MYQWRNTSPRREVQVHVSSPVGVKRMSVKDLQMIFGFSTPQAIYKWQQGVAMPTIDNLVVLSVVFGVAIDDIIVIDKTDIGARIA